MSDYAITFISFCERFIKSLLDVGADVFNQLTVPISDLIDGFLSGIDNVVIEAIAKGIGSLFGSLSLFELMFSVGLPMLLLVMVVKFFVGIFT